MQAIRYTSKLCAVCQEKTAHKDVSVGQFTVKICLPCERRKMSVQMKNCPHCGRELPKVHQGVCTSLGCGKRLDAPVEVYSHPKNRPELYKNVRIQ